MRFLALSVIAPFAALAMGAGGACAAPARPSVLVSIKPIHSIVAAVMQGAGQPDVLLRGAASPHSYAMRPSDAQRIARAEIVFWVGPELENFLERPLANLAPTARVVALIDAEGITRLPTRTGGLWEAEGETHASGEIDGHIWLDPKNGIAIAREAARVLGEADPERAQLYSGNAESYAARLKLLDLRLADELAPVRGRPYIVFHDAYQYFEARYGLTPAGAVTVASDRPPGAGRIAEMRTRIGNSGAICILSTPQFSSRLLATLTGGTKARIGTAEDMGANVPPGPSLYQTVLTRLAGTLVSCLGG